MSQFRISVAMAIVLLVSALAQTPATANGEGAEVYNRADGFYAFFQANGAHYSGPATLVRTPSGNVRGQARTTVISGTAVTETTYLTIVFNTRFGLIVGDIVLTPSGNGNVHFSD